MRWHTEEAAVQQHAAAASKIAVSIALPLQRSFTEIVKSPRYGIVTVKRRG
jgi:hypothetical protein